MKKSIKLVAALAIMMIALVGCAPKDPVDQVKGTKIDAGRISSICPEGYNEFMEHMTGDSILFITKAEKLEDIFNEPSITVYYGPLGSMLMSSRGFYEDAKDIEGFTLGQFDWTGYTASGFGSEVTVYESEGDYGMIIVQVTTKTERSEQVIDPQSPEVKAIIKNISVVTSATADWVELKDGQVTVTLPVDEASGKRWELDSYMSMNDAEAEVSEPVVSDGKLTVTINGVKDGLFKQYFLLSDDEYMYGQRAVSCHIKDGKITEVTLCENEEYDEPHAYGGDYSFEAHTLEDFIGSWHSQEGTDVTVDIVDNGDETATVTVKMAEAEYRFLGAIDSVGDLNYEAGIKIVDGKEEISDNFGWFTINEDEMSWFDSGDISQKAADLIFTR